MFAKRIERLSSSLVRDILASASHPDTISFAGGLPAQETLYKPSLDALAEQNCWQYGQTEGEPELRQLIAEHGRALGIDCTAEQVLVLSGSQQGIDLVAKLFIDEQTPVLVEAPAYLAAIQVFNLFGARMLPMTVDSAQGPDLAQFDRLLGEARLAYLTPTFQNPSSYCYPDTVRAEMAEILDRHSTVLFEDDPYRDLSYEQKAPNPLVSHLKEARWIYQGSFSKTLSPGLRLGFIIAHPDLMQPLVRLKQAADLHSNRLSQFIVADIMNGGLKEHVESVLPVYRQRRDAMDSALKQHLSDHASWQLPQGGLFFWLKLNRKIDTNLLMRKALEGGLAVMPGFAFYCEPQNDSYLRLNFSHANPDKIEEGVKRLAKLLAEWPAE
jgi:2-aminoadipate transaminase